MLILDLTTGRYIEPEPDLDQAEDYPEEVLESEWNPALEQLRSVQPEGREPSRPAPVVIDTALKRLK